jgi:pSer/pThr/pTyr-binding forkhead associated (FHA) protein
MMKLIVEERGEHAEIELEKDEITIGRTADNGVKVHDALSSRHHCKVQKTKDGFVVEDLKSRNGTTLNGIPLTEKRLLAIGDRIGIGECVIHFGARIEQPAPAAPPKKATSGRPAKPAGAVGRSAVSQSSESARAKTTAKRTKSRYALKVVEGSRKGVAILIDAFPVTVGKKKSCSLVFEDEGVSDEHCMLVEDDGAVHVVDLNSEKGTLLDGKRVKGREKAKHGSILECGSLKLKLKDLDAVRAAGEKSLASSDEDLDPSTTPPEGLERPAAVATAPPSSSPKMKKPIAVEEVTDLEDLDAAKKPEAKAKPARGKKDETEADAAIAAVVAQEADVTDVALEADISRVPGGRGGPIALVVVVLAVVVTLAAGVPALLSQIARADPDPPLDEKDRRNLVSNWSFEEGKGLDGWEGDGAITTKGVQYGLRALALDVSSGHPRAEFHMKTSERVTDAPAWVARCAVRLEGHAAAGVGVVWTSDQDAGYERLTIAQVLERPTPGWRDLGGVVRVPPGATHARLVGFALALGADSGTAWFDRARLVADKGDDKADKDKPKTEPRVRGPAGVEVAATPRAVFSLLRAGPSGTSTTLAWSVELAIAAADGSALDPVASQSAAQLLAATADPGDGGLAGEVALLDPSNGARLPLIVTVRPQGASLRVRYELAKEALAALGDRPLRIAFEIPRLRDAGPVEASGEGEAKDLGALLKSAEPVKLDKVSELSFGRDADQCSLRLAAPALLEATRHGERVLVALIARPVLRADGAPILGFDLSRASTGARARAQQLLDDAESAKRDGHLEAARRTYERIAQEFQHEEQLAARATAESRALSARADLLAGGIAATAKDAEDLASPDLLRAAKALSAELEKSFPGSTQAQRASAAVEKAERLLARAGAAKAGVGAKELLARAVKLRESHRIRLARAIYEHIVARFPADDPAVKEAKDRLSALPAPIEGED